MKPEPARVPVKGARAVGIPVYARVRVDTVPTATDAFVAIQRDVNLNGNARDESACEWSFTAEGVEYTITARAPE
jgi:hypothetical protein